MSLQCRPHMEPSGVPCIRPPMPPRQKRLRLPVMTVNGVEPDANGNVDTDPPDLTELKERVDGLDDAVGEESRRAAVAEEALGGRIAAVEAKVPAQASDQNQLADKAFVNSSIATNTAFYISDGGRPFQSLADLENYEGALTNNDYAFVVGRDADGNTTYTRYKWNEATETWGEEYVLNNSSFTAEQWAAISSGITSGLVAKLGALPTAESLAAALAGKADKPAAFTMGNLAEFDANGNPVDSGKKPSDFQDKSTIEDSVSKDGGDPVKSSGIWSAIWGKLSSIPFSFSSLYDWVKGCFASPAAIAPRFDPAGTYAVGDVRVEVDAVGASGLLYRCKKGYTSTSEHNYPSGDPEHWEAIDVNTLIAGKLDKGGGTFGNKVITFTDEGVVVFDLTSGWRTLLSSSNNFLARKKGDGTLYIYAAPNKSGTLALTADPNHPGNLAALDADGNPVDSGVKVGVGPDGVPYITTTS